MEYEIALAVESDWEEILGLYRSLIGRDGCTWNADYPTAEDVREDIRKQSLYIIRDGGAVIAAAAAGEDEDLAGISGFRPAIRRPCVLSRIAVDSACQNRGIAKELIRHIEREAVRRGFDGIHLIVSKTNFHAKAVYDRMGYACCGECTAFGLEWYCYEKEII